MTCSDVRDVADSFLSEQLLTETNHEILRHLDACPLCRVEIDARRRLRGALRTAFHRSPALQPPAGFQTRLRDRVQDHSAQTPARSLGWGWLALAAGVLLCLGAGTVAFLNRSLAPAQALASDAVGDHRYCALTYRLARSPVPLETAATQFDSAYRLLVTEPPDEIPTAGGPARVLDRHACVYDGRRFGHVIFLYRGRVVSLLMTSEDGVSAAAADLSPHVMASPTSGLSVVSIDSTRHAVLLVGDLSAPELVQLSEAVALPLARRLQAALGVPLGRFALLTLERPSQTTALAPSR
jgi:hypothetical protein